MTRRDDIKAETRQLILKAAGKLFRKKGVEKCTMRAVAKEAGVSPGTVMLHFKSKVALLEASVSEEIQDVLNKTFSSMPKSELLMERLMHIPKAMFMFYNTDRDLYRTLVKSTVFEPEQDNPMVTGQLNAYMEFIASHIQDAKEKGIVHADTDPHIAASSLASLYIGVLILFFRTPYMAPEAAIETLSKMKHQYLKGILTNGK